jgi:hypothetical protein
LAATDSPICPLAIPSVSRRSTAEQRTREVLAHGAMQHRIKQIVGIVRPVNQGSKSASIAVRREHSEKWNRRSSGGARRR